MCQDNYVPFGSCFDYAGLEELRALRDFERSRDDRMRASRVYYNECSAETIAEGHVSGPGAEKCWCGPKIYESKRGTEIVHNPIVPLNGS